MMPNAEDIAAYRLHAGIIYRLHGSPDLKVLPLAADKIKFECRRTSRKTGVESWFERHFDVICVENTFRIVPTPAFAYDDRPVIDAYTLGNASPDTVASGLKQVDEVLENVDSIIAEHIVRSRLELWRMASLADEAPGEGQPAIESLWFSYMEAETAMASTYPGCECDFIVPVEEATGPRI